MHDGSLKRTTNIQEVVPHNATQDAAMFSWDTLKDLNAGKWFLEVGLVQGLSSSPSVGQGVAEDRHPSYSH